MFIKQGESNRILEADLILELNIEIRRIKRVP